MFNNLNIKKFSAISKLIKLFVSVVFTFKKIVYKLFLPKINSQEILIISLQKIGDTVFAIPTIKYLYKKYENRITVLCYSENEVLLKQFVNQNINSICLPKELFFFSGYLVKPVFVKYLKKNCFNEIYDITGNIISASVLLWLHADNVFGLNVKYFDSAFTKFYLTKKEDKLTYIYFNVIKLIDKNADISNFINNQYKKPEVIKILINPFAGWKAKEWDIEKFIELGKILSVNYEVTFNFDKFNYNNKLNMLAVKNNLKVTVTQNLDELIDLLKNYTLFIGNDSGPLYIAAEMNIPTFTIYGPTNPYHSLPISGNHSYIQKDIECTPKQFTQYCFTDAGRAGCNHFNCMNQLSVEEVYSKVISFINNLDESND